MITDQTVLGACSPCSQAVSNNEEQLPIHIPQKAGKEETGRMEDLGLASALATVSISRIRSLEDANLNIIHSPGRPADSPQPSVIR